MLICNVLIDKIIVIKYTSADEMATLMTIFTRLNMCLPDTDRQEHVCLTILKVIYHPLYGMNNYVLIWGDWLSCDPLRGSHDSQSPHIWG